MIRQYPDPDYIELVKSEFPDKGIANTEEARVRPWRQAQRGAAKRRRSGGSSSGGSSSGGSSSLSS